MTGDQEELDWLQARITALLLEELDPREAAQVRQLISTNPSLASFRNRMRAAIELVRESADYDARSRELRLTPRQREALLALFRTRREPAPSPIARWAWLVPAAAAAGIIGLLTAQFLSSSPIQYAATSTAAADKNGSGPAPPQLTANTPAPIDNFFRYAIPEPARSDVRQGTMARESDSDRVSIDELSTRARQRGASGGLGGELRDAGITRLGELEEQPVRIEAGAKSELKLDDTLAGKPETTWAARPFDKALHDAPATQAQTITTPSQPQPQPQSQPQPEVRTADNPVSTFSLNVSDVSFRLAAAAFSNGTRPDKTTIRTEEFLNAFNYHDPAPAPGSPLAFAWEQAHSPFAHNRDLIRFSIQTASAGREPGRPLNLVLLLDNSGSMERSDRIRIVQAALGTLARQLTPQDRISVVAFARTPRLWVDALPGGDPDELLRRIGNLTAHGGTNLELALDLGYETAGKHFLPNGINRVILLTDGAANLGDVDPSALRDKVEHFRKRNIALDCFGVGWEGFNDDLLEVLARNGDGRYGFINHPEEAAGSFASQLAGALRVAASDVKAQVEFNPRRVLSHRQLGYEKHQLTREQFRDNTVDAAEIGAAEAGTALYAVEIDPAGIGPIATVRVRYKIPHTRTYQEKEWLIPFNPAVPSLNQASPSMRLAAVATAFAELLAESPHAASVTIADLRDYLAGVPEAFPLDPRPRQLQSMLQ